VHTNPILICFCSILYYPDLAEHLRRYKIEKKIVQVMEMNNCDDDIYFSLRKFRGKLTKEFVLNKKLGEKQILKKKVYNQLVLNRWHLFIRLNLNKELIPFRSHNLRKKKKTKPKLSRVIAKLSKKILFLRQQK